ncbi:MAG: domain S-box protein [Rhodocyclaceae bacterium]|nr:domain S-box protein [Rhodocyclaceae bacterium]
MADRPMTPEEMQAEILDLRARLEEAQETISAIRSGDVDALVLGSEGEQIYTRKGAEEPYRVMVEAMTEGAVTLAVDGTILYCNARFADLLKLPLEYTLGSALQGFVAPAEHHHFETCLRRSREAPSRWETALQTAEGIRVPVQFSTHPLKVDSQEAIAAVITDLSAIAAAAEAKSRLALIVESSEDAIVSTSLGGVVDSWNAGAEQLFGYAAEEAIGRPLLELLVPPKYANEALRDLEAIRSGGRAGHQETVRLRKDGTPIDVSATASPIKDSSGRIIGVSSILRDITARHLAEDEVRRLNAELEQRVADRTARLEAANKELEAFAYSVSHDLRSPLRAIDGFSRKVVEGYGDRLDDEGRRELQIVRDSAQRMNQLIDDILAFSRTGRLEMAPQRVNMEAMAKSVAEEARQAEPERSIEFAISPLPPAWGDPALLRQVWGNLIGNAVKFTRRRPVAQIEIGGQVEGGEIHYWVKDNGAGFDMAYAGKLFGVFQRLHRQDEYEGSGVGLAIAQRILHRHNGRIWAEGQRDGGATFHFALPVSGPDEAHAGGQAS